MDRAPGDIRRDRADAVEAAAFDRREPVDDERDGEYDALMEALPPTPGLPSEEDVTAAEERAMIDHRDGRSYGHAIVSRWLLTWGQPGRKRFHEWLADQDG